MIHLGDITQIHGDKIPVVDVITGGSPCQDLSVAGKRAGLSGERSGLFMDQIRIVKEMRKHDSDSGRTGQFIRPRYMVWENVPGAFSSNGGKDFQAVLEEIVKIKQPGATVPEPPNGKWSKSGCIVGDGFSLAWRVHDAQFWGVPQRRKRIALVADFGGLSAPEILFERKGLSGDPEQSGTEREEVAGATGDGTKSASGVVSKGNGEAFLMREKTSSLAVGGGMPGQGYPCVMETAGAVGGGVEGAISFQERAGKPGGGKGILIQNERTGALSTFNNQSVLCLNGQGGSVMGVSEDVTGASGTNQVPAVVLPFDTTQITSPQNGNNPHYGDPCHPLAAGAYPPAVAMCIGNGQADIASHISEEVSQTLNCMHDAMAVCVGNGQLNQMGSTYQDVTGTLNPGAHPGSYNGQDAYNDMLIAMASSAAHAEISTDGVCPSLLARAGTGGNNMPNITRDSVVRRLTPLECERLQGYPDGWTDIGEWVDSKGKKHKEADSPRYKALGNSIALPFWQYLARRICAQYERDITMGSLFDGIGGFPLVFERCGAKAVWASEIEEYCVAVTKRRFGEE